MLRMLGNKILVRRKEQEPESSMIQVVTKQEPANRGEVLAVGPGTYHEKSGEFVEMAIAVGDVVIFGQQAGVEVTINGEKLLVLFEPEVYGILPN